MAVAALIITLHNISLREYNLLQKGKDPGWKCNSMGRHGMPFRLKTILPLLF